MLRHVAHAAAVHGHADIIYRMHETVEDIAREAGVSVGALYTRFKGKDELLTHLLNEGGTALEVDMDDEITRECCVTHAGEVVHARTREAITAGA